jgi:hypothetical protein
MDTVCINFDLILFLIFLFRFFLLIIFIFFVIFLIFFRLLLLFYWHWLRCRVLIISNFFKDHSFLLFFNSFHLIFKRFKYFKILAWRRITLVGFLIDTFQGFFLFKNACSILLIQYLRKL